MKAIGAWRARATIALLLACVGCTGGQATSAPTTPTEFVRQLRAVDSPEDLQALHPPECDLRLMGAGSRIEAVTAAVTDEATDSATITATFDWVDSGLGRDSGLGPHDYPIQRSPTGAWHFVDCPAFLFFEL